jgi:hypothetical protein
MTMADQDLNITIAERNLAGNPIIASMYLGVGSGRYRIVENETNIVVYEGIVGVLGQQVSVDISQFFENERKLAGVHSYIICNVDENNANINAQPFLVFGGGISKLLQRKLAAAQTNVFTWKLKNVNKNFFLSTRTNNRLITIPEDELLPLKYYAQGLNFTVKSNGETLATYNHTTDVTENVQSIDFNALRLSAVTSHNKLISVFDIITDTGGYACTILITEVTRKNDYFLKFVNSWGVFEKIAIEGMVDYTPTFSEPEDIAKWDAVISDFVPVAKRKTITSVYKAEMGYKTADERMFLIDAILSEECYLAANDAEYEVKLKTDSGIFQSTDNAPKSISITLELIDMDDMYSAILVAPDEILGTSESEIVTANDFKILV